ncbi:MAG: hypothetical protein E7190_00530 [Erysipelotrichaceae bacterium]|nr:hypothetical protein [Erysipelotrichaceae bacterium]
MSLTEMVCFAVVGVVACFGIITAGLFESATHDMRVLEDRQDSLERRLYVLEKCKFFHDYTVDNKAMKNRNKINQFKHEYAAYVTYDDNLSDLRERLYEIDCAMDIHSPNMSGIHYAPVSRDERLANYVTKRDRILKEIARIEKEQKRISEVLNLMNKTERKNFEDVYRRKTTYNEIATRQFRSPRQLRRDVDREILRALSEAEEGYSL